MNRKILASIPLAVCTAFGSAAMANDILFQGRVIDNTCTPTVDGQTADATIALNPISSNVLTSLGSTGGGRTFDIALTGCGTTNPHIVKAYFWQANAGGGRLNKNPTDTGTGTGWQYQILDATGTNQVDVGTTATVLTANNSGDAGVNVGASGGTGTLTYTVRYYRSTGTLNQGQLNATATYVLFSS